MEDVLNYALQTGLTVEELLNALSPLGGLPALLEGLVDLASVVIVEDQDL